MNKDSIVKNSKNKWIIGALALVCISLGLYSNIFSLIGLLVCLYAIMACSDEDALFILFLTMSFANIFKMSPTAQSFYTYILMFYVLFRFLKKARMDRIFVIVLLVFVCFLSVQLLMSINILRTIKFVVNILFIYVAFRVAVKSPRNIFLGYTTGIIVASILSVFNLLPNLGEYLEQKSTLVDSIYVNRFSGLYPDPNYYAVNIIIALCLMIIIYHRKEIKLITFIILSLILVVFALLTYSKSAFFMLLIPIFMFLYSNSKNRRHMMQLVSAVILVIFGIYLLSGRIEFLSTILTRIDESGNMSELTTGRSNLWEAYWLCFKESWTTTVFGSGFGADLISGKAAHNTYIDLIYYLGIVGSGLLFATLYRILKVNSVKYKKNILNYSVLITILIMYFFLSQLFYFDMPFHILIALIVMNMNVHKDNIIMKEIGNA